MKKRETRKFKKVLEEQRDELLENTRRTLGGDIHLDPDDFPDEIDTASSEQNLAFQGKLRERERGLLSKIMLALLMLPLAALIYTVVIVIFAHRYSPPGGPDVQAFAVTGLFVWGFIAIYWTGLWRRSVNWTSRRIGLTIALSATGRSC